MNSTSKYLYHMALTCSTAYAKHPSARAGLLSGSAAQGVSDQFSDIDMMLYYESLPDLEYLDSCRISNGSGDRLWRIGEIESGAFIESYPLQGVECQIVHTTITAWKEQMDEVLVNHAVDSPLQKALSVTQHGISLFGDTYIQAWKQRVSSYPDALRDKMIAANLAFFPVWNMGDRFFARDANLWFHQIRVETLQKLLAIVSAINGRYFTTFQFKHMEDVIRECPKSPSDFCIRIEKLLAMEPTAAAALMGNLILEVLDLIEIETPHIEIASIRKQFNRKFEPCKN